MKLTQITKRAKGMTLLELTVVILVLLSLISILFVGARAWKKGSDRAANVMIVRNVQQAVRSYQNMNIVSEGTTIGVTTSGPIFGSGNFIENIPTPPVPGLTYTFGPTVPGIGTLFTVVGGTASDGTAASYYAPTGTQDW